MKSENQKLLRLLKDTRPKLGKYRVSNKTIGAGEMWTSEGYCYYEERRYFGALKITLLAGYLAYLLLMAIAMQGFVYPRIMISFSLWGCLELWFPQEIRINE